MRRPYASIFIGEVKERSISGKFPFHKDQIKNCEIQVGKVPLYFRCFWMVEFKVKCVVVILSEIAYHA